MRSLDMAYNNLTSLHSAWQRSSSLTAGVPYAAIDLSHNKLQVRQIRMTVCLSNTAPLAVSLLEVSVILPLQQVGCRGAACHTASYGSGTSAQVADGRLVACLLILHCTLRSRPIASASQASCQESHQIAATGCRHGSFKAAALSERPSTAFAAP